MTNHAKRKSLFGTVAPGNPDEEHWDRLEDLAFQKDGDHQRRKGGDKRGKALRDPRVRDERFSRRASRPLDWREWLRSLLTYVDRFVLGKQSRRLGSLFVFLGLLCYAVLDLEHGGFRYNTLVVLALAAAAKFPHLPLDSVRPQLCLSVLALFSFAVDALKLIRASLASRKLSLSALILASVSKVLVLFAFLRNTQGGARTRKYLDRRVRLFLPPCSEPKRIMRDVRGRCLALCLLHALFALVYAAILAVLLLCFDYSPLLLSSSSASLFWLFLLCKMATTLIVFGALLYDTDVRLALWHFGCLVFCSRSLHAYITARRVELQGWPLAFSFSELRFYLVCWLKVADVLCGAAGFSLIAKNYLDGFLRRESSLQVLLVFTLYSLAVTDVYVPCLFFGVHWLRKKEKKRIEHGQREASDDSEIDELDLREPLQPVIERESLLRAEREKNRAHYIEEELRHELHKDKLKSETLRKPTRTKVARSSEDKKTKANAVLPHSSEPAEKPRVIANRGKGQLTKANQFDHDEVLRVSPSENDNSSEESIDPPAKRMSPFEFVELWNIFVRKQCTNKMIVAVRVSNYFNRCCGYSGKDTRAFLILPAHEQRATLLRAVVTHFSRCGVQVVSAGINSKNELTLLCCHIRDTFCALMDVNLSPLELSISVSETPHQFALTCIARGNSLDASQHSINVLSLDHLFFIYDHVSG